MENRLRMKSGCKYDLNILKPYMDMGDLIDMYPKSQDTSGCLDWLAHYE